MKESKIKLLQLCLCCIVLFIGGCEKPDNIKNEALHLAAQGPEVPEQTIGVNFNGQFDFINYEDLERTQTTWVRGFVDFFQLYPNVEKIHTDQRLQKYLTLKENGYKTILNIKWDFSKKGFPESGSAEMEDYKRFLRKLLSRVWKETDIIVVGNEPFIESLPFERDQKLVNFYTEIAQEVQAFKKGADISNGIGKGVREVAIYLGAFNNLYLPGWRTPAVDQLLQFAKEKSWVAGIDLHIHHGGTNQINYAMDYVDPKLRDDQRIIITEYSLMKHWKSKMGETIPKAFASKYGRSPEEKNYQYLDHALKEQVSRQEWIDYARESYWFYNKRRYLWNSYLRMKSYSKFHVATYSIRQSYPFGKDFTRNTDPWILNGLFANRTVEPDDSGRPQFNYSWIEDFILIQNNEF